LKQQLADRQGCSKNIASADSCSPVMARYSNKEIVSSSFSGSNPRIILLTKIEKFSLKQKCFIITTISKHPWMNLIIGKIGDPSFVAIW
jgi:hypothetical protein